MLLSVLISVTFIVLHHNIWLTNANELNDESEFEDNEVAETMDYKIKGNRVYLPVQMFDLLMGRYGRGGGIKGTGYGGGVVYTRFGRTSCPSTEGTQLLYAGLAGGSRYNHKGGGANYLCLPNNPEYLSTRQVQGAWEFLYGAEYQHPVMAKHDYNVPCSVCYAPRGAKVMIPAAIRCPDATWTKEFRGYLMTDHYNHPSNKVYECVDEAAESIPGTQKNTDGALFYHAISACGEGLKCPPYVTRRAVTCVVCTK